MFLFAPCTDELMCIVYRREDRESKQSWFEKAEQESDLTPGSRGCYVFCTEIDSLYHLGESDGDR